MREVSAGGGGRASRESAPLTLCNARRVFLECLPSTPSDCCYRPHFSKASPDLQVRRNEEERMQEQMQGQACVECVSAEGGGRVSRQHCIPYNAQRTLRDARVESPSALGAGEQLRGSFSEIIIFTVPRFNFNSVRFESAS